MPTTEGVIKFALDYEPGPAPQQRDLGELNAWRRIFRQLGLIGQDPARYDGFGFGNLSRRIRNATAGNGNGSAFVISGTQTGGLSELQPEHYVTVLESDPVLNRVVARGPIKPSSESLTHGILYQTSPAIEWVMHLHSPDIHASQTPLHLPVTCPNALCGTPQMAVEVARIQSESFAANPGLIVMGGHQDGILVFGTDPHQTGSLAVATLARALSREQA